MHQFCINSEGRCWIYRCREGLYSQSDHPVPAPSICRAQQGHNSTSWDFTTLPPCQAGKPLTVKGTEKRDEEFLCSVEILVFVHGVSVANTQNCPSNGQLIPLSLGRGVQIRSNVPHADGSAGGDSLVWPQDSTVMDLRGSLGTLAWVRCVGSTQREQGTPVSWDKPAGRSSADTRAGMQEHQDPQR